MRRGAERLKKIIRTTAAFDKLWKYISNDSAELSEIGRSNFGCGGFWHAYRTSQRSMEVKTCSVQQKRLHKWWWGITHKISSIVADTTKLHCQVYYLTKVICASFAMNYAEGPGKGQTDDDTSDSQTLHTLIWHLRWNSNAFRGSWKLTHHISRTDKVFDWKRPQRKEADGYTTFPWFLIMKIYRWCSSGSTKNLPDW